VSNGNSVSCLMYSMAWCICICVCISIFVFPPGALLLGSPLFFRSLGYPLGTKQKVGILRVSFFCFVKS